jgi:DNA polymerase-1
MGKVWLVLDVQNLAYRAMHTTGDLQHDGQPTGCLFGIFKEVLKLTERFDTRNVAWCFDSETKGVRETEFPSYKLTRRTKKRSPEDEEKRAAMRGQVTRLRRTYLDRLGYRNVFYQEGYEADDLIAAVVLNLPKKDKAVLVSGDHDLWQLISDRVSVYHPVNERHVTKYVFDQQWPGLRPQQWKLIKGIAGCKTDDVHGLEGVAEKTAVKAITSKKMEFGELTATEKTIVKFVKGQQYRDNLKLVSLPYPGTNTDLALIVHRPPAPEAWGKVFKELGMTSLLRSVV